MKKMLIVGGSKGIGKACADYFLTKEYIVTTVARTSADIIGDITNENFRNKLITVEKPNIVIICAGLISNQITETMNINYVAASDLISKFYNSLSEGSILINLSSIAAIMCRGNLGISSKLIAYNTSKDAISNFCMSLARSKTRDVKITTLEPEFVIPTDFSDFCRKSVSQDNYDNYSFDKFVPLKAMDIISSIEWVISQPPWVNICRITINNHFNYSQPATNK